MSQPLTVLGGITAEQFLTEYWQKKPLLVRNAMPEIVGLIEPDDVKELALEEHVSARLIRQKNKNPTASGDDHVLVPEKHHKSRSVCQLIRLWVRRTP